MGSVAILVLMGIVCIVAIYRLGPGPRPETKKPGYEVRYHQDKAGVKDLDEIVADHVKFFHLERMANEYFWFCLELEDGKRIDVHVGSLSGRAKVEASVVYEEK